MILFYWVITSVEYGYYHVHTVCAVRLCVCVSERDFKVVSNGMRTGDGIGMHTGALRTQSWTLI